jgi:uncharacterized protein
MKENFFKPHLFGMLAGLFLAAGLVFSALVGSAAWIKIHNSQFVSVKGSAHKNIKSDLAVWRGSFSAEAATLLEAQRTLKDSRAKVDDFLNESRMTNHMFDSVVIEEARARFELQTNGSKTYEDKTVGYKLTQSFEARTPDPDRIAQLNADSTALVEQGVLLTTEKPKYIYTKVAEEKIEMLADATKDARARAERIAAQGGGRLSRLHSADMGVFQITPINNSETTWDGVNDTTSVDKTITAVVTATFTLE